MTMISIVIPYYKTQHSEKQLARCIESIKSQTYTNYSIEVCDQGSATENINFGVKHAKGDMIITLGMDDYFTNKNSLQGIVDAFTGVWGVHGVSNNVKPYYTGDIHTGNNKMGGVSSIICRKDAWLPMDETTVWLFDCDWHKQMYIKYGEPCIIEGDFVTIEIGEGQSTNKIDNLTKYKEFMKMSIKYA